MKIDACFLSCGKDKAKLPCKASEMYLSLLFKKSLLFAEQFNKPIYILSAKYHLISINTFISPYELTLNDMDKEG